MHQTQCVLETPQGSRFINLLCKHWRHKFEVEFDENHGFINMLEATCRMEASPSALKITVHTEASQVACWEEVLVVHLQRYVKPEEVLHFDWTRSEVAGPAGA